MLQCNHRATSMTNQVLGGGVSSYLTPSAHCLPLRNSRHFGLATPRLTAAQQYRHRAAVEVKAAATHDVDEDEDLWQYPDRDRWYAPTFVADDAPDWNPAVFVNRRDVAVGVREVTLQVEISRDKVPLRNAYLNVGQKASVRVNAGEDHKLAVATAPFPRSLNHETLLKARGDMLQGEIKEGKKEDISVMAELKVLVGEGEAPDVYNMTEEDLLEVGPFQGTGVNLRGPINGIFHYPTIIIFCEGMGIAAAKSLLESPKDSQAHLSWEYRQAVRLYYRAANDASIMYRELFSEWEENTKAKVITSTRDSFGDMFDFDDTLTYEPGSTAAIILTGEDQEAEEAAIEACKDAEITCIVRQSQEMEPTVYH